MILRAQLPLPFLQLIPLLSLVSTVLSADSYIGCYSSLPSSYSKSSEYEYQSSAHCDTTCANYAYFALHNGNECICGNSAPSGSQSSSCNVACYGYGQENCGGSSAYSFWSTGNEVSDSDDSSSDGNSATSSPTSGASGSTTASAGSPGSSTETSTSQRSTAASTSDATATTSSTTPATTTSSSTTTSSATGGSGGGSAAAAASQSSASTTEQTSSTTKAVSTESNGGTTIVVMSTVAVSATPTVTATTTSIASGTVSSSSTKSSSSTSATASKGSSSSSSSSSKSSVVGPVVGGVVGGVAFLAILALLVFLFKRRNERARDAELADSAYQDALKRDPSQLASRPISNPFLTKEEHLKMTDQRLNPVMLGRRRISEGSLADEADYSRKILRVANPDDDEEL